MGHYQELRVDRYGLGLLDIAAPGITTLYGTTKRWLHLHPKWQRRVAADLKATFPAIQFVCTSHSPQVIGELSREEVQLLSEEVLSHPQVTRGADSNWILDHVMEGAASENAEARALQQQIEDAIEDGSFPQARGVLEKLKDLMEDGLTGELVGLESRLASLEALAEVDGTNEPGEHP